MTEASFSPESLQIEELRSSIPAFENLLEQMRDKILANEFETFICDETSGRVPAIIIYEVIKMVRRDAGLPTDPLHFETYPPREAISDYLNGDKKVLFLTEYIFAGDHVRAFLKKFEECGVKADVATLHSHNNISRPPFHLPEGTTIYIGGILPQLPDKPVPFREMDLSEAVGGVDSVTPGQYYRYNHAADRSAKIRITTAMGEIHQVARYLYSRCLK